MTSIMLTDSYSADINECRLSVCSPNAKCINTAGSFECICKDGYTGNGSTCTDACDCCSNPCKNGGTCIEQGNGFMCKCRMGYEGVTCETRESQEILVSSCACIQLSSYWITILWPRVWIWSTKTWPTLLSFPSFIVWLQRLQHKFLPMEVDTIEKSLLNLTEEVAELVRPRFCLV